MERSSYYMMLSSTGMHEMNHHKLSPKTLCISLLNVLPVSPVLLSLAGWMARCSACSLRIGLTYSVSTLSPFLPYISACLIYTEPLSWLRQMPIHWY